LFLECKRICNPRACARNSRAEKLLFYISAEQYPAFRVNDYHSHDTENPLQKGLYAMPIPVLYPLTGFSTYIPTVFLYSKYPFCGKMLLRCKDSIKTSLNTQTRKIGESAHRDSFNQKN
jgi:hypothetical protein